VSLFRAWSCPFREVGALQPHACSGAFLLRDYVSRRFKLGFAKLASMLMCLDHIASFIVNANHSIMRMAPKLPKADFAR
jgi:hypothetical protein